MSIANLSLALSIFCFVIVAFANGAFSPPQFGSFQFINFGGKTVNFGAKNVGTTNNFQAQVPKLAVKVAAPVQSFKTVSFEAKTAKTGSFEAAIFKPRVPSATCPTCSDQVRFLSKCKDA